MKSFSVLRDSVSTERLVWERSAELAAPHSSYPCSRPENRLSASNALTRSDWDDRYRLPGFTVSTPADAQREFFGKAAVLGHAGHTLLGEPKEIFRIIHLPILRDHLGNMTNPREALMAELSRPDLSRWLAASVTG